jgi:hypothetical protein
VAKIKIVFAYLAYPMSMAGWFRRALERRSDVELWITGPFTGSFIPWAGGMNLPEKYVRPVDFALPPQFTTPPWSMIKAQLPWKPDLVLQVDAGFNFADKPDCLTATVATDPHVLDYSLPRSYSDKFFNMQKCYSEPGDIYCPYAFDPTVLYPDPLIPEDADCCLIGLHYENRNEWIRQLRARGHSVIYELGPIFDEYRQLNCRASIGLNWSSLNDVCARVFEIMGMGRTPVLNRVPDLEKLGLIENTHHYGFSSMDEAVQKVEIALKNPDEAHQIAKNAHDKVWKEDTWDLRVEQILKECGLLWANYTIAQMI